MAKTDYSQFSFVFSNISLKNEKVQIDVLRWLRIKKSHLAKFYFQILLRQNSLGQQLFSPSPSNGKPFHFQAPDVRF